jgi:hypothetical protein
MSMAGAAVLSKVTSSWPRSVPVPFTSRGARDAVGHPDREILSSVTEYAGLRAASPLYGRLHNMTPIGWITTWSWETHHFHPAGLIGAGVRRPNRRSDDDDSSECHRWHAPSSVRPVPGQLAVAVDSNPPNQSDTDVARLTEPLLVFAEGTCVRRWPVNQGPDQQAHPPPFEIGYGRFTRCRCNG